jgi:hypothetical protein
MSCWQVQGQSLQARQKAAGLVMMVSEPGQCSSQVLLSRQKQSQFRAVK